MWLRAAIGESILVGEGEHPTEVIKRTVIGKVMRTLMGTLMRILIRKC